MDQILLCSSCMPQTTAISNTFIDTHMLHANGSYVKVYLYLAMCIQSGTTGLSISSLADNMENTEKDILRALLYWERNGLIRIQRQENDIITGVTLLQINPSSDTGRDLPAGNRVLSFPAQAGSETVKAAPAPEIVPAQDAVSVPETIAPPETVPAPENVSIPETASVPEPAPKAVPKQTETTAAQERRVQVSQEQSSRLAKNEEFVWICRIVENYLERPLNPAEVHLLIYLYDNLHFSEELILYLYEYCCSLQKTNVRYVQTVAFSWADNGVTTPAQAQEMAGNYSSTHSAIAKALALGRPLAGIEKRFVERWEKDWQMDLAVILEACNRTMLTIQKADFKYIEGILNNWHKNNVHTLQDIEACDASYKNEKKKGQAPGAKPGSKRNSGASGKPNQFQTFQQRNASAEEMDELEKMLLTKS